MAQSVAEKPAIQESKSTNVISTLIKALLSNKELTEKELESILQATCKKALQAVSGVAITIYLVDKNVAIDQCIRFKYIYYTPQMEEVSDEYKEMAEKTKNKLKALPLRLGQGIVGKVIQEGKAVLTEDVRNDPNFNPEVDKITGFKTYTMITAPFVWDGVVGAMQVVNKMPGTKNNRFTEEDLGLLQEVADYSARVLKRAVNPNEPLTDIDAAQYLARLANTRYVNLDSIDDVDAELAAELGEKLLKKLNVFPLGKAEDGGIILVVSNPLDFALLDKFRFASKVKISRLLVSTEEKIKNRLKSAFRMDSEISDTIAEVGKEYNEITDSLEIPEEEVNESSAPIVQLATRIIEDAYVKGASDIHVEPFQNEVKIRYRIDGVLHEMVSLPYRTIHALVSRLKIMSDLDISERRLPQDGRIKFRQFTKKDIDIDLRVATGPMAFGEKIVMRILDKTSAAVPLEKMGYSEHNLEIYRDLIKKPYGMILHCGPTGSGKTTALYAALNHINQPEINIQTAEDPVEYMLTGINQMQMQSEIGLTFARALRCYLRQDPDVIMVGEIRDLETAEIAIEAALTGHLMFSTLHTNDAPSTVTRFIDMGIQPFLISSSLLMVVAQRLARRLCKCKEEYEPSQQELEVLGIDEPGIKLFKASGCPACGETGYKGRMGVHELLTLSEGLIELIERKASSDELKRQARKDGMKTLFEDGALKVKQGLTSLEELLRVVRPD
ncbi:MAG: GAF domain-containing protein [candidate division Zixibacteria bacterium]|nr:GAF domain-containing protein [candidate division Zixibacteria bacterium]